MTRRTSARLAGVAYLLYIEDAELALLALTCRVGEGIVSAIPILSTVGLLWLGAFLLALTGWGTTVSATFFAAGSTLFSYLLLRGRIVPVALGRLGVVASVLVLVCLPAQLVGALRGRMLDLMWIPMLVFEIALGLWLLAKGVRIIPETRRA
jgi:hypothetical protein